MSKSQKYLFSHGFEQGEEQWKLCNHIIKEIINKKLSVAYNGDGCGWG